MSKFKSTIVFAAVLLVVGGCQSLETETTVDALISEHTEESLNELTDIISQALAAQVTLGPSAFIKNNRIVIEHRLQQTIQQNVIQGKQLEQPPVFVLTLTGSECRVVYEKSQQSWLLEKAHCIPKNTVNN